MNRPTPDLYWTSSYTNGNLSKNRNFEQRLLDDMQSIHSIDIISGYVGMSTAEVFEDHFVNLAQNGGQVRVLIGMAGVEGLSRGTYNAWRSVDDKLRETCTESGVFSFATKVHAKLYVMKTVDKLNS